MAASSSMPTSSARAVDRLEPPVRRALDQAIDHVRRFAETQRPSSTRDDDRPRHRDRAPLDPAGKRRRLRPRRLRAVPVVAGHDRRPRACRRGRARSSSPPPPIATGTTHPVLLGAAGLLEVDAFIVAGGRAGDRCPRLRTPGRRHRTRRSDRRSRQRLGDRGQDRGLRRGRHRPAGRPIRGDGPGRAARRRPPRRRRPHHPGRARPGFAGDPGHDRRGLRGRGGGEPSRPSSRAPPATTSSPPRSATTAGSSWRRTWTRRSTSSTPTGRSTCRSTSSRSSRRSRASATPVPCSSGRGRRSRPATTPRAPTTSCRPAAWPARPARCRSRRTASSARSSASTARVSPRIRETIGTLAERRGPARPPRRRRDPVRARSPAHEPDAGDVLLADRPGVLFLGGDRRAGRRPVRRRPGHDRPLRPQHLPHPAGAGERPAGGRAVRGGPVRIPADRLPPPRRGGRRALRRRPERDHRRCRRGRDPRHRGQGLHHRRWQRRRPDPDLCDVPRRDRAARRRPSWRSRAWPRRPGSRWTGRPSGPPSPTPAPPSSGCAARTTRRPWPSPTERSRRSSRHWPTTPPRPVASHRSSSSTRPTRSSSGRR